MMNGIACAAGHSFGADGAIIASTAESLDDNYERDWTSILPMAPPEPPVITPEKEITLPIFMIGGSSDCLCPPPTNWYVFTVLLPWFLPWFLVIRYTMKHPQNVRLLLILLTALIVVFVKSLRLWKMLVIWLLLLFIFIIGLLHS